MLEAELSAVRAAHADAKGRAASGEAVARGAREQLASTRGAVERMQHELDEACVAEQVSVE